VLEVTSTRTAQFATPLVIGAPATVMTPVPAVAVTVMPPGNAPKAPPAGQLVCTFGVAATTRFVASVSVKPSPACAGLPAALVIVKVSVEVPPRLTDVGEKDLSSEP
jgi:hypothetical protein